MSPVVVSAHACPAPAVIEENESDELIGAGAAREVCVPSPSWPLPLDPQHITVLTEMPQLNDSPTLSADIL
jgi:hypothetical protein